MEAKKAEVEIDKDGGEITLEVAATYASVGAWWIFKKDVDADSYETLGKGQSERRTKFAIIESAKELIGDTVSVLVIASSLKSGESMAGASVKVCQGDEMLAELDDQARVEGSHRFEFEIQLQEG